MKNTKPSKVWNVVLTVLGNIREMIFLLKINVKFVT
jgi:hypothetical protein